ncbi:arsenate reductase ArsC [Methanoregula sp.]|jgi:arsenate reductase (thioredoxin)|uniref:arsenate reductase ArsC n=1 Tax=Methanoregula sp. TaxID=2052170 RepID=UPI003C271EDA
MAKYGDRYDVFSAGTRQSTVSPRAIAVIQEIGINISHHRSKQLDEFRSKPIDIVVTVCDRAHKVCPVFSYAKKTLHQGFRDPHAYGGSDEEILAAYRSVRNDIAAWIDTTFGGRDLS